MSPSLFFQNIPDAAMDLPYAQYRQRIHNLRAVAERLHKSLALVDLNRKQVNVLNYQPLLSDVFDFNEAYEQDESVVTHKIPEGYYSKVASQFSFILSYIRQHTTPSDNDFYFSLKFPLEKKDKTTQMIEWKIFLYLYTDDFEGRQPWIICCSGEPSEAVISGGLTLHNTEDNTKEFYLNFEGVYNGLENEPVSLREVDLEIFKLTSEGYSENEIAESLNMAYGALKSIKSSVMLSLRTRSSAQTIAILHQHGLL